MREFDKYSISSKILFKCKVQVNKTNNWWDNYVRHKMSRDNANRLRKRVVSKRGNKIVNRRLKNTIREYCQNSFGSASYWPWIALYTELRGEFKRGWMPNDYYRFCLLPKMNPEKLMRFSEVKTLDHKLFNEFMVEPLLLRINGNYYNNKDEFKTISEVRKLLDDFDNEIVIKPVAGRGGKQIIFKKSKELRLEDLTGKTDYVFQRIVKQHSELNKLHPHSINTFRVTTYIDKNGSTKVKFIIIRYGRGGARVDNASSGGGWIFVNPDGTVEPDAFDGYGNYIGKTHPDTGISFADLELPFMDKIINFCKNAHHLFPHNRIIGWDVFVDEKENPKLIEWNANNPFFMAIEAHYGPFFKDIINK